MRARDVKPKRSTYDLLVDATYVGKTLARNSALLRVEYKKAPPPSHRPPALFQLMDGPKQILCLDLYAMPCAPGTILLGGRSIIRFNDLILGAIPPGAVFELEIGKQTSPRS
jgi:hypothetical protein